MASRNNSNDAPDPRRAIVLALSITLLVGSLAARWYGEGGSGSFATSAMGRIGLVMGALWLAWPSLQRPAQWLPPGIAVAMVVALGVLAAQPKLIFPAIFAITALFAVSAIVRSLKR
jgi:hypothetical protein